MRVCASFTSCVKYLRVIVPVADKIGLKLSAKACFDPTAAPECVHVCILIRILLTLVSHRMFKRLGALEKSAGGLNVSFLNTHPTSDERVKVKLFDPLRMITH